MDEGALDAAGWRYWQWSLLDNDKKNRTHNISTDYTEQTTYISYTDNVYGQYIIIIMKCFC